MVSLPGPASWKEPIPLPETKASSCGHYASVGKENIVSRET